MQSEPITFAIAAERLRARCDPAQFTFATTAELPVPPRMVGQDRASDALDFGLNVPDSHYNIFVAGPPGSGRSVSTEDAVRKLAETLPVPSDWCYVHNFETPYAPHALELPAGRAKSFARDVDTLIDSTRSALRTAFDAEAYRVQRDEALRETEQENEAIKTELDATATAHRFIVQIQDGDPSFLPMKPRTEENPASEPFTREEYEALPAEQKAEYDAEFPAVQAAFAIARAKARALNVRIRDIVAEVDKRVTADVIAPLFTSMLDTTQDMPDAQDYLRQMQEDIIKNSARLRADDETPDSGDSADPMMAAMAPSPLTRYRVNVLVDNSGLTHAPCIHEHNPTYYNLVGRLEYGTRMGNLFTDFTFIKPGALHSANGGFLIIHAREMLTSPKAWEVLKRSLRTNSILIENLADPQQSVALAASLKPVAIPLKIKVILLGDYGLWDTLNDSDPDFAEIFKVRADFDGEMPRNRETEHYYAQFVGDVARESELPPLAPTAVARIIEEGSRMVDDQRKLSTSLTSIRDLVIESSYWARRSHSTVIDAAHIDQAIKQRRRRNSLFIDHYNDQVRDGTLLLASSGLLLGQVNALSTAVALGQEFGRPMRISARTAPGLEGVVAIERETKLSGPVHTKGVLTLSGYLAGKYGQEQPLSLTATLAFEQTYSAVEGDSASLAELCVLLSALSNVPIRQNFAVTGSVNQWGQVQAVGGVTLKVEAFFDLCQINGVAENQGVIIPESNVRHLMLRPDVIEAVRNGAFHVYAVRNVEDAVELLMGRPAGRPTTTGVYLQGTINALVSETLRAYAERVRYYRQGRE